MPPAVKQLWERAFAQFRSFSVAQRAGLVGGAVAVIVLVMFFSRWSGKPDMAALYTDLAPADAAAITERLSSKGVGYELADQGTTVKVPRDQLYDLRLEMSADGIPSGGTGGWSILDDQGITTSEFSQQVGYQRAMEGELSRTVASLDAVQTATVHLVLPKRDAFVLDETKASASVLVRTRPGKSLNSSQVQAIVNLVSSSVQGLTTDAVTVADTAGNVLNAPGQSDGGLGTAGNTRMEQTSTFENTLASEIESMLGSVVGAGKAVVTVNADLDFDKSTATSETYTAPPVGADGQPLADSESNRSEEYQGAVPGDTGVLGPTTGAAADGGDTSYTLTESSSDNALNRIVETTERAPGAIDRLSVAVLVDDGAVAAGQVGEIQNLVSAAAGVDAARGDQVVVTRLPFDTSTADATESELAALDAQKQREERMKLYTTIGAVVVVLGVLAFTYRAMTKSHRRRRPAPLDLREEDVLGEVAATSVFDEDALLDIPGDEPLVPELPPAPVLTEEEMVTARIGAQVANLVDQQPDEVALLLRTWLGDRRTVKR
jgi:flagellar M-ring protein FliF